MKSVSEQKQSTPKIAPSFGPNEKPETVKIVVIHIFVCSDNTNVFSVQKLQAETKRGKYILAGNC